MSATITEAPTGAELVAKIESAMWEYLTKFFDSGDDVESGPSGRLGGIHGRLEDLLALPKLDSDEDPMFQAELRRAREWFAEDREVISELVGRRFAEALDDLWSLAS